MNLKSIMVKIEGRVQGVGFRYWTESNATRLGLSGWVRNRRDGTVEALFSGNTEAIEHMLECCYEGPKFSGVKKISYSIAAHPAEIGFTQRPSL